VFYTREVQGVQMWLTRTPNTYFIAIDMTVALQWETKVTAIDQVLG